MPGTRGFVGGTADPTGLVHLGAREYDPTLGRFLSVDPVIDINAPAQMNAYSYAHNNPVTKSDPSGLCPADLCGIGYPIGGTGTGTSKKNPVRYIQDGPVDPGGLNTSTCHRGCCCDGMPSHHSSAFTGDDGRTLTRFIVEAAAGERIPFQPGGHHG
ncbi:RHS repeat-associated core domain-containing protein [Streptomyces lanatus]|uniref:RHS repeat-associated core domain-containing protein n=1 Tax=Streptomyces lanatus TaxID=66900 RepID=UPI00227D86A0|nr:RHS repeat-associated core domain-containing protein [Streptomyces lanatus]